MLRSTNVLPFATKMDYIGKIGVQIEKERYERVNEIPLDRSRKIMTTEYTCDDKNNMIFSKGAPEIIISKCKYIDNDGTIEILEAETKETLLKKIGEMSGHALRVIGFAYKTEGFENPESDLTFTGLLGLIDPPKKDAAKALQHPLFPTNHSNTTPFWR